jgi:hypothetical protein
MAVFWFECEAADDFRFARRVWGQPLDAGEARIMGSFFAIPLYAAGNRPKALPKKQHYARNAWIELSESVTAKLVPVCDSYMSNLTVEKESDILPIAYSESFWGLTGID